MRLALPRPLSEATQARIGKVIQLWGKHAGDRGEVARSDWYRIRLRSASGDWYWNQRRSALGEAADSA
jgi:hypothetical protein